MTYQSEPTSNPQAGQKFKGPQGTDYEVVKTYEEDEVKWITIRNLHNNHETTQRLDGFELKFKLPTE